MGAETTDGDIDAWVGAGIITSDQADRIRAFDATAAAGPGVVREVLGYLGAALLVVAALLLVGDVWEDLGRWQQVTLCASVAAALIVTGTLLRRGEPGHTVVRISRTCLMLATVPVGMTAGLAADSALTVNGAALVGCATASAYAAACYVQDRSWAQHVALFGAIGALAITIEPVFDIDAFMWLTGGLLFGLGLAWLLGSTLGHLPPRLLGEVLGAGALGFGSVLLVGAADPSDGGGALMMLAMIGVSVACLAVGARLDRVVWLAVGVIGLLGYVPWLLTEVFGEGLGVPIGLAIAGLALLLSLRKRTRS